MKPDQDPTRHLTRHRRLVKHRFFGMVVVLLFFLSCTESVFSQEQPDSMASAFHLKDISGRQYVLQDFLGENKAIVIVFWSTWGKDSGRVLGDLEGLFQKYKTKGLVVFGVCVEELKINDSDKQKIADSIKRNHVSFPVLLDEGLQTFRAYSVVAVPTTFVIDKTRKVVYKLSGYPITGRVELADFIIERIEGKRVQATVVSGKRAPNKEAVPLYHMARKKFSQGQNEAAKKYADRSRSLDSLFVDPALLLVEIAIEESAYVRAELLLGDVLALEPESIDGLRAKGLLRAKQGMGSEAVEILKSIARRDSLSGLTHCYLGYALGVSGALKEALDEFRAAEEKSRNDFRVPALRAEVYELRSMLKEAESERKHARQLRSAVDGAGTSEKSRSGTLPRNR